jgi:hypothetical protein
MARRLYYLAGSIYKSLFGETRLENMAGSGLLERRYQILKIEFRHSKRIVKTDSFALALL